MQIIATAQVLFKVREICTYIELLFEGKWWINFLKKIGLIDFHGLANQAHNELVKARNMGLEWDANRFKSKFQIHRDFEDPLRQCQSCRSMVRMRPTLKNIILKRLKIGKYKNANLLAVD